jgi:hypothetical protein
MRKLRHTEVLIGTIISNEKKKSGKRNKIPAHALIVPETGCTLGPLVAFSSLLR